MKKVLVLSYFFPPCNLTASQRSQSWANYLSLYGYKPIIITRRWDEKISHLSDVSKSSPNETKHEVYENYEVFYLPYQSNLRDKIYVKYKESRFKSVRQMLTFFELLLQPFFDFVIPYNNIGKFALNYLKQNQDVKKMVVTGNPFNLFKFAFTLNKETSIKWIADYRDAWTTSEINLINKGWLHKLINYLETYFEKKWVGTASLVTASSQPIANHVGELVNKQGYSLYNGFVAEDFNEIKTTGKFKEFTITYVGTLYDGQKVEIFCEAFKKLIDKNPSPAVKLIFPGLSFFKAQEERIKSAMKGYERYYECTERVERAKILAIEKQSHLLLHVAWDEHSGIIASKIYEYIASGTFILVTPTDNGAIEEIVQKSKCGICTKTIEETFTFLNREYENYLKGSFRVNDVNNQNAMQFSRQKQAGRLAELLDKI
jgi:glycosyltransferase involved in cell wall biosynthesis